MRAPFFFRPVVAASLALSALISLNIAGKAGAEQAPSFAAWLDALRHEARRQGIGEDTLEAAFAHLAPLPRVVELDKKQPEFTLSLEAYLRRTVTPERVARGRRLQRSLRPLLREIERRYGVQRRFLLALWALESDFGEKVGNFPVVAALASLAYDGRRPHFFRKELLHALRILEEGHITLSDMQGSWAGAMGQVQFMPSTFMNYAADYDGDGTRNIWTDTADALASAAHYLSSLGWDDSLTWGREVRAPESFRQGRAGRQREKWKTLAQWQALGVRRKNGASLPTRNIKAALIFPDDSSPRAFLVYRNFEKLMLWNRSHYFGVAIGALADALRRG